MTTMQQIIKKNKEPRNIYKYQIAEIPDPLFHQYQMLAGGDVSQAAHRDSLHLMHAIANMPPESARMTIAFQYDPTTEDKDIQSRLKVYVTAEALNNDMGESLKVLFEQGPLSRFYRLIPVNKVEKCSDKTKLACRIVRRVEKIQPLHPPEFNDRIPSYYYSIQSFKARSDNDYMDLDRLLGGLHESVIISINVEPIDTSPDFSAHTRYLSLLQSINRTWDRDDEDAGLIDFKSSSNWISGGIKQIKPLHYTDPLADTILRQQQRFHETLQKPHLKFSISIFSETVAVGRLVGSVVAESAFIDSSYRIVSCEETQGINTPALRIENSHQAEQETRDAKAEFLYSGLFRLNTIASVEELSGLVCLPIASCKSPSCIRKNTDPPHIKNDELIILGHDLESPGVARGITLSSLSSHMFLCGTTGSGKTSVAKNIIFEFSKL